MTPEHGPAPAGPWDLSGARLDISRTASRRAGELGWTDADVETAARRPDVTVPGRPIPRSPRASQMPRRFAQRRHVRGDLVALVEKRTRGAGFVVVTVERLTAGDFTWEAIQRTATGGLRSDPHGVY